MLVYENVISEKLEITLTECYLTRVYRSCNLRAPLAFRDASRIGIRFYGASCKLNRWQPLIVNTKDSQYNFSSNQRVNLLHFLSENKCSCYFSDLIMQPAMLQIISISLWIFL